MKKSTKAILYGAFTLILCIVFICVGVFLFQGANYFLQPGINYNFVDAMLYSFQNTNVVMFAIICILSLALATAFTTLIFMPKGAGTATKANVAGDGQHGTARWITEKEQKETFDFVVPGTLTKPGFVLGYNEKKRMYIVDTSDSNMALVCPPGFGKTRRYIIPTIILNAMIKDTHNKPSMLIMDAKGDLYNKTAKTLEKQGYRIIVKNLRTPMFSNYNNDLQIIIDNIQTSKAMMSKEEERLYVSNVEQNQHLAEKYTNMLHHKAVAEKYTKILSETIVKSTGTRDGGSGGAEKFFDETAKGLITALILLVAEFADEKEAHLVSVFKLIVELNGLTEESSEVAQKTKLEELFSKFPEEHRSKFFAGASIKADIRTSMNVFASALSNLLPLIDVELEQILCRSSEDFAVDKFVDQPTAYYIIVPDEDRTKHFLATLSIRLMQNELIAYAESHLDKEYNAVLPRPVLNILDEFGNADAIKDFDVLTAASRSRNIRTMIGLQSTAQLEKVYGKSVAKIITGTLQLIVFSATTPADKDGAKLFSDILSTKTILTGSNSSGSSTQPGKIFAGTSANTSTQLMKRNLMNPDELQTMPKFTFVALKSGCRPLKSKLPDYSEIIQLSTDRHIVSNNAIPIPYVELDRFERRIITSQQKTSIEEKFMQEYEFSDDTYVPSSTLQNKQVTYTEEEYKRLKRFVRHLDRELQLQGKLSKLLLEEKYQQMYEHSTELMQKQLIKPGVYEDFRSLLKI